MNRKELARRLTNIRFLKSVGLDFMLDLRVRLSSSSFSKIYRNIRPYTICGTQRLRALYQAVEKVDKAGTPGDIVECGVAKGGSAALMGLASKELGMHARKLWLFDTFEGMPMPEAINPDFDIAKSYTGECRGTLEDVSSLFAELELLDRTVMVKGLIQNSLPNSKLKEIAILHIDTDWFESVKTCLEQLYDRVEPGGIIQIDDYGHWEGAKRAVDEFLETRSITQSLNVIDYSGRQLIKM